MLKIGKIEREVKGKRDYLDLSDKSCNPDFRGGEGEDHRCGTFTKQGVCEKGHHWVRVLYCGKEWCPVCRKPMHNRRIARLYLKVWRMRSFGYLVITIPEELRMFFKDKDNLNRLRTYIRRKLKRMFPGSRGIMRWHWFGDRDLFRFNPHLNVMIEALEYISPEGLEVLKEDYKAFLERLTGVSLGSKKVDIYYQYYTQKNLGEGRYKAKRFHILKYITRPTFLINPEYDRELRELAKVLKGYRTTTIWGRWEELSEEELERAAFEWEGAVLREMDETGDRRIYDRFLLHSGICPICRTKIRWLKGVSSGGIPRAGEDFGDGFYLVRGV